MSIELLPLAEHPGLTQSGKVLNDLVVAMSSIKSVLGIERPPLVDRYRDVETTYRSLTRAQRRFHPSLLRYNDPDNPNNSRYVGIATAEANVPFEYYVDTPKKRDRATVVVDGLRIYMWSSLQASAAHREAAEQLVQYARSLAAPTGQCVYATLTALDQLQTAMGMSMIMHPFSTPGGLSSFSGGYYWESGYRVGIRATQMYTADPQSLVIGDRPKPSSQLAIGDRPDQLCS